MLTKLVEGQEYTTEELYNYIPQPSNWGEDLRLRGPMTYDPYGHISSDCLACDPTSPFRNPVNPMYQKGKYTYAYAPERSPQPQCPWVVIKPSGHIHVWSTTEELASANADRANAEQNKPFVYRPAPAYFHMAMVD